MKKNTIFVLGIILMLPFFTKPATAQLYTTYNEELLSDTAVIVVTGLKINNEGGEYLMEDLSLAEGATVRVTGKNGSFMEKKTETFPAKFYNGETFYSADFQVNMDSVYTISITFTNGIVIIIDDYRIDNTWKRHHYFHWTTGNKSPASILRKQKDEKSGLWCYVYSLFPLKNYKLSGGNQVK